MALDDQLTPDQLDEMIGEIDTDGSGTVDFEGKQILQHASVST
jgi:Ca2+-binding EF-hand superfamily protein